MKILRTTCALAGVMALTALLAGPMAVGATAQSPVPYVPVPPTTPGAGSIPEGFTRIFNGKDMSGWHPSRTAHHGKTPSVTVKDGALYLAHKPFGQGGLLLTNKKYKNFEFYVETDLRPGYNSGIFLRATEEGAAVQVELDANRGNGGLLTESLAGVPPRTVVQGTPIAQVWKQGEWNSFRVRVEGDAPHYTLWVNGVQIWDIQYSANYMPAGLTSGFIGLQFHFLTTLMPSTKVVSLSYNTPGVPLGFRNMAIKELPDTAAPATVPAAASNAAAGGRGGAGGRGPAPLEQETPPPPPGPADYTNAIGMDFMKIQTGTMIEGAYDPCEILPVPAGTVPPAPAPLAQRPPRAPCSTAGTFGWRPEQYETADRLLREDTILGFKVTIGKPYLMGRYEVTQGEWKKVMGANPSIFQGSKVADDADRHPVENVSWEDAQAFVKKLNALEHTTAYRLPTEFEWEWASRAGQFRAPSTVGEREIDPTAVMSVFSGPTWMVGSKLPNAWGLYDMLGNVWEWVQDVYNEKVQPDPIPPTTGTTHVLKGGSYMSHFANVAAAVHAGGPGDAFDTGFRIVKDVN
ncbi:MAG TPA: SUMF1/EgtB/PvdO family nonheme iron enzyme [Vicinamibacterales bacterium]|nr:SUMF1/EgtB/PvdO family nonheme iron enzyme [Vicinamibacterales bacterium]